MAKTVLEVCLQVPTSYHTVLSFHQCVFPHHMSIATQIELAGNAVTDSKLAVAVPDVFST